MARGDETDEALAAPQMDDALVFAYGDRAGQVVAPADVVLGGKQLLAYPLHPATGRIRDGSRLNQLIVVRLPPEKLTVETRARAADGVVAYSGVCTHTGCDVTDSVRRRAALQVSVPRIGVRSQRRRTRRWRSSALAARRAAVEARRWRDRRCGPFEGRVGFQPPGLDPFGAAPPQ